LSHPDERYRRVLVVRTDRLGDVLLTLPILSRLRSLLPHAHLSMLLRRYTGEIVEGHPGIDETVWYDTENGNLVEAGEMVRTLRTGNYDIVLITYSTARLAWLMFRAGIPERVGTGYRYYSVLFTKRIFEHRRKGDRHELEHNFRLLAEMGLPAEIPPDGPDMRIVIPGSVRASAMAKLPGGGGSGNSTRVILHPGSGGSSRDWPADGFTDLARRLRARGMEVLVTGGPGEEDLCSSIARRSGATSLAGLFTLRELAAVIGSAALFVGNSTGPLHLAVAMGTPVLGLYPQLKEIGPGRWGPYTKRSRVLIPDKPLDCTSCRGRGKIPCACMSSISGASVEEAVVEMLAQYHPQAVPSRVNP
jgi:heptosyltransferase III